MAYNTVALERILKKELGEMCMSEVKYPRWGGGKTVSVTEGHLLICFVSVCG